MTSIHSDNEMGITALAMDFAGMGIQLIQTGAGMHVPIIERRIRTIKEGTRGILGGVPYTPPLAIFLHLPIWVTIKMSAFHSSALPDDATPFSILHSRPFNITVDAKYQWGSLHYVSGRETDNTMTPRATACIAIGQVHNGTGTGLFYSLSTGHILKANHSIPMPFSSDVIAFLNSLSAKDQRVTSKDPYFQFHGAELHANQLDNTTTGAQHQTSTHRDQGLGVQDETEAYLHMPTDTDTDTIDGDTTANKEITAAYEQVLMPPPLSPPTAEAPLEGETYQDLPICGDDEEPGSELHLEETYPPPQGDATQEITPRPRRPPKTQSLPSPISSEDLPSNPETPEDPPTHLLSPQ